MNYLITGGAGFIGSAIAHKLIQSGYNVYIIDNLSTGLRSNVPSKAIFIEGDFSNDEVILKLNNIQFDVIFHIGGQSSGEISFENPEYDIKTNTLSTLKLLQYCIKTKSKKIVYASSMSVYGEEKNKERYSEDDIPNPKSFYAIGKYASEQYLRIFNQEYGIEYVILRYFNVYGPGQNFENLKQGMLSIYLKQFLDASFETVLVKGSSDRFRDLIYIDDVVDISIESATNSNFTNQIINIGTGEKTTVGEMLDILRKYSKKDKKIIISQSTPGDQFGIYSNNKKLLSLYKKQLTSLGDGVKKTLTFLKQIS